jgi:hypothetical protein
MTDEIDQINRKLKNFERLSLEKSQTKEIMLPDWHVSKRGTPNTFLRSALFSAVQRRDREYKDGEILYCQNGILIRYTGQQLNQDDLTLWETLIHLAKKRPLDNECQFTAYEILKSMGLSTGKNDYERLGSGIMRLTACLIQLTHGDTTYLQHLIDGGEINETTGHYKIRLNRELIKLYGNSHWTAIDWQQRLKLRRKPLAQALHGYYSSHREPYPVTLVFLQRLTGGNNKQLPGFKRKVEAALKELVKIGFLKDFKIDGDMVSVERNLIQKLPNL